MTGSTSTGPVPGGAGGGPPVGGGAGAAAGATGGSVPARGGEGVDPRAADRLAIQQVLNQYVAAYNDLYAAAVARLVPSQPPVAFAQFRSYKLTLSGQRIDLEGDTATVTCVREIDAVVRRGNQTLRQAPATTFKLRRSVGGSWVIESVK